jgi:Kdo2-lipid IVA lauroyltransferase/acyltransferase
LPRLYLLSALDDRARRLPSLMPILWHVEAGMLRMLVATARKLPVDRASDFGAQFGRIMGPRTPKHRHVLRNLSFVRPDWTSDQIEEAARGVWENAGRVLGEMPHLATICHDVDQGRVEVAEAHRGLLDSLKGGERPAIFVAPHLANWNLPPIAAHRLNIPLSIVFSAQRNPAVEAVIAPLRAEIKAGHIPVADAGRGMLAELRKGRSIGLLMDLRFDEGEMVPFFGVPALTAIAPARLCVKLGIELVPARVERLGSARYRITVHRPIPADKTLPPREAAIRMVSAMNALFEEWIGERPEEWLCAKRRWPDYAKPMMPKTTPPLNLVGAA